jgi:hypothetical protein
VTCSVNIIAYIVQATRIANVAQATHRIAESLVKCKQAIANAKRSKQSQETHLRKTLTAPMVGGLIRTFEHFTWNKSNMGCINLYQPISTYIYIIYIYIYQPISSYVNLYQPIFYHSCRYRWTLTNVCFLLETSCGSDADLLETEASFVRQISEERERARQISTEATGATGVDDARATGGWFHHWYLPWVSDFTYGTSLFFWYLII